MPITGEDKRTAMEKFQHAAEAYDRYSAAAANLNAFDAAIMAPGTFREALRVLFNMQVTSKELGYLISLYKASAHVARGVDHAIDCKKFIGPFLALGKKNRSDTHAAALQRQREASKKAKKLEEDRNTALWKGEEFTLEPNLTQEDLASALEKMTIAAAAIDMTHSSAPSLKSFTGGGMKPTIFRDLIKTTLGLSLGARDFSAICIEFMYDPTGGVQLGQGQGLGVSGRPPSAAMAARPTSAALASPGPAVAGGLAEGSTVTATSGGVLLQQPSVAASSITAPSSVLAPEASISTASFNNNNNNNNPLGAFGLPPPRGAQLLQPKVDLSTGVELLIDSKIFLIRFAKLGTEAREKARFAFLDKQRVVREDAEREKARKKRLAEQKLVLDVDNFFTESDRQSAIDKLIKASAKYDKNSPGCMGLDAFDAAYLTPLEFREVIKRVFALNLTPKGSKAMTHPLM